MSLGTMSTLQSLLLSIDRGTRLEYSQMLKNIHFDGEAHEYYHSGSAHISFEVLTNFSFGWRLYALVSVSSEWISWPLQKRPGG